jgi:Fe2+ or Zn2+ uptake regulation protein
MSCNEICEIEKRCKVTTIYKHIRILEEKGYVKKGAKIERAFGYILTSKAIDLLPKEEMEENKNE